MSAQQRNVWSDIGFQPLEEEEPILSNLQGGVISITPLSEDQDYFSLIQPWSYSPRSDLRNRVSGMNDFGFFDSDVSVQSENTLSLVPYVYSPPAHDCKEYCKENEEICPICIAVLSEQVLKTNCNHIFHESCLRQWFEKKQNCPCCRKSLKE